MFSQDQLTVLSAILGRDLSKEVSWFLNARARFGSALTTEQQMFVPQNWREVDSFLATEKGRTAVALFVEEWQTVAG